MVVSVNWILSMSDVYRCEMVFGEKTWQMFREWIRCTGSSCIWKKTLQVAHYYKFCCIAETFNSSTDIVKLISICFDAAVFGRKWLLINPWDENWCVVTVCCQWCNKIFLGNDTDIVKKFFFEKKDVPAERSSVCILLCRCEYWGKSWTKLICD